MELFIRLLFWILNLLKPLFNKLKSAVMTINYKKYENPLMKIPGPTAFPVIGASWLYSGIGPYSHEKYHEANEDKYKRWGPVVREHVLHNFPLIHVFDKNDIMQVLGHNTAFPFRPPNEADVYYRESRPEYYSNVGIVNLNGPQWKELRKVLTKPLTNRDTPKNYIAHMNLIADDFINLFQRSTSPNNSNVQNFKDVVYRTGLETVCTVALERRMGFLADHVDVDTQAIMESIQGHQTSSNDAMYGLPWWKYVPKNFSSVFTKLVNYKDHLFKTFGAMVDETLESIQRDHNNNESILNQLLRDNNVDIKDVKASVVDYITAGVDTIGNSVIFVLLLIAKYPEKQRKLQEEIDSVIGREESEVTLENLSDMPYLKACIQESFRMYPTASQIARIIMQELKLESGYTLPVGSVVLCHHLIASLQSQNFTKPKEFIPERWLNNKQDFVKYLGTDTPNHNSQLVLPFGYGKRICPGKRLAEQEIQIITTKLLQAFDLTLPEADFDVEFRFLLVPSDNVSLSATPRVTT